MTARVGLVGANGYGLYHRRALAVLQATGAVEVVGLCDLAPIHDEPDAPIPPSAEIFTDYRDLLTTAGPDVVVIATPPHTHLEIAAASARAGADILVEKPPLRSTIEHERLTRLLAETGQACQVGFQALGSAAHAELVAVIRDGRLGRLIGIGAYGAWQRPDSYYDRTPWAGRRVLDGVPVLDGALANPFAHAVMQAIAVAEAAGPVSIEQVEVERYRARSIEVDDTGAVRLQLSSGLPLVVAVTLCADEHTDPVVVVHGERGRAELAYTTDRLRLPGDSGPVFVTGRERLLDNLLAHRERPDEVPLIAPLARTAPFTAVVEAVAAVEPAPIDRPYRRVLGRGPDRVVTVARVSAHVRAAADRLLLLSELGIPWARRATVWAAAANGVQERGH